MGYQSKNKCHRTKSVFFKAAVKVSCRSYTPAKPHGNISGCIKVWLQSKVCLLSKPKLFRWYVNCVEGSSLTDQVCVITWKTSMGSEITSVKLVARSLLHQECVIITSTKCTTTPTTTSVTCVGSSSMWASNTGVSTLQAFLTLYLNFLGNLRGYHN